MWLEIWSKMIELNSRVLRDRHSLGYVDLCNEKYATTVQVDWILKYTRALIHEVAEYYEEEDNHKEKIELIDVLFFMISVIQVAGFSYETFEKMVKNKYESPFEKDEWYGENMIFSAVAIETAVAWKHWKTYETLINKDMLLQKIEEFVKDWQEHVYVINGMTPETVYTAFMDKLQVNHHRQDTGYASKETNDDIHVRT